MVLTMPRESEFWCGSNWIEHSPTRARWLAAPELFDWQILHAGRLGVFDGGREYRAYDLIRMAEQVWRRHLEERAMLDLPSERSSVRRS